MTPENRAIAVDEILAQVGQAGAPADRVLAAYTRSRRYIGSGDRRAIADMVWSRLRAMPTPPWLAEKVPPKLLDALLQPATADFIVTSGSRDKITALHPQFAATPYSPIGVRAGSRVNMRNLPGVPIQPQDESSQIAAVLCDAQPEHKILDYCAGAGGKSLALSVLMNGKGTVFAYDIDRVRLETLKKRLRAAGVENVKIAKSIGMYDRFIIDAPCSGSGVWRRAPDARFRLTPEKLDGYAQTQAGLLNLAARHTLPGGRIVYMTCSVLECENEAHIEPFLRENPGFSAIDMRKLWAENFAKDYPGTRGDCLRLDPLSTQTDGFFIAVFQRA
ncbi:MAG: RsmB/NOP family class I SAM-dependent RNA methyltransferase [Alphaproteobacteria bacterium]|nr:RsmB/NOP family class I SAM-dependent RNA methyltransferase [Alphaproteobacteria bacterium]